MVLAHEDGSDVFAPVFACDVCGVEIEGQGNYEWLACQHAVEKAGRVTFWDDAVVYFSHKGCSRELRARFTPPQTHYDVHWYSDELTLLPGRLLLNLQLLKEPS